MLNDLIVRLETAAAPDSELDAEIWMTLYPAWRGYPRDDREEQVGWMTPRDGRAWLSTLYTSSIDAALTLVPEGWFGSIPFNRNCDVWIRESNDSRIILGRGVTPAIGLCIAALKAREQSTAAESNRGGARVESREAEGH